MPPQSNSAQSSPFEIVTSGKSKKTGKKGIVIAVLIVVFLILSVIAGVLLVRQRQLIQQKAQVVTTPMPNTVNFPKAGKLRIYYYDFTQIANFGPMLMQFTKGGQTQSATLPGGPLTPPARMEILDTNIDVAAGDTYSIRQFYGGNTSQPSEGWIGPSGGKCGPAGQADVAQQTAWATDQAVGEPLVSLQCWADYTANPNDPSKFDFNDFYIILSYVPLAPTPSPSASPTVAPTASPTGSPTASPSLAPTPSPAPNACGSTCTSNNDCASGLYCLNGACKNPLCSSKADCNCTGTFSPTPTPTAKAAQTSPMPIPQTGIDWPTMTGVGVGAAAIIISILLAL